MRNNEDRESWTSRPAFLLAAIGSAVGFGNIWRFPALAYKYGGGSFFIPYILAVIFIGFPLLLLEIALGQHLKTGDVGVFGCINTRLRGVGLSAVLCGFLVTGYYVPLLSWVLRSLCESFGEMKNTWSGAVTGSAASDYFFNNIVGMETLGANLAPTRLVFTNVFYLFLSWITIGGCVFFGIKWTGRIAYFTMGLPIVLLFLFLFRAITLPNAGEGIQAYIGNWDTTVLTEHKDIFSTAVSQVFFSLGTTFGIMTAFGSHCPNNSPATENAAVIAVSNSLFSFIAGFGVFGSLGYLKYIENAENFEDVVQSGPSLMFGAYPAVLSTLHGGIHWIRLLFFNLFLLGIDSAFALTEALLTVVKDSAFGKSKNEKGIVIVAASVGCLMGLIYVTDAGLIFLDVVDFYVNFIMLLIGFSKAFAAGWMYDLNSQIEKYGIVAKLYITTTFGALFLASLCWFGPKGDTTILGFIVLILSYGCGMLLVISKLRENDLDVKESLHDLCTSNVLKLTSCLEMSCGNIPKIWPYLIKHVIPQVLLVLFVNLVFSRNEYGIEFSNYEGYPAPFQAIGILVVIFISSVSILGFVKPQAYELLSSFDEKPFDSSLKTQDDGQTDYVEMSSVA